MEETQKQEILSKSKVWFKETLAKNHVKNTEKLVDINKFNVNPFLVSYLANYLCGDSHPESIARALVYPRVLGSSITTSFGTNIQTWISTALEPLGSVVSGIDIEYIDAFDGRRKYCQLKAGPNTLNKDDVPTVINHFNGVRNLARTNNVSININDMVLGIVYGEPDELSAHYKKVNNTYPVIIGQKFWHRLTADENFYFELAEAFAEVAQEINGKEFLESVIQKLAKSPEIKELSSFIDSNNNNEQV
jgi:hypothetical protein